MWGMRDDEYVSKLSLTAPARMVREVGEHVAPKPTVPTIRIGGGRRVKPSQVGPVVDTRAGVRRAAGGVPSATPWDAKALEASRRRASAAQAAAKKKAGADARASSVMERFGDEGASGLVRQRAVRGAQVAGATTSGAGLGYLGYKTWDSRRKPVEKSLMFGSMKRLAAQQTARMRSPEVASAFKASRKKLRGPINPAQMMSTGQQPVPRPGSLPPIKKSFDDEYVSKVSLRPVLSAVKSTAKKVMGGVKGGWEASKPQQPFEVMNAPVAAGKSLGTQVGYAARGGWEQLSQGQKYAGMAAGGTGLVGTGVGVGLERRRVNKAADGERRTGWRSNSAIGGALLAGSAGGVALSPRDFKASQAHAQDAARLKAAEVNERRRAGRWYRTPRGRKKMLRTADDLHLHAVRSAWASSGRKAQGVAAIGLGAAGAVQGGRMLYRDQKARRSGN